MSASRPDKDTKTAGGRCPICGAPTQHAVRPFCSPRCADVDLGRWVSGAYVISAPEGTDGDEDGELSLAQNASGGTRDGGPDAESR